MNFQCFAIPWMHLTSVTNIFLTYSQIEFLSKFFIFSLYSLTWDNFKLHYITINSSHEVRRGNISINVVNQNEIFCKVKPYFSIGELYKTKMHRIKLQCIETNKFSNNCDYKISLKYLFVSHIKCNIINILYKHTNPKHCFPSLFFVKKVIYIFNKILNKKIKTLKRIYNLFWD